MKTFDELFEGVIKHEGYYANVKGDKGGETYMGVARKLHPKWEGWKYIDSYKEMHGKIEWNFKLDIPELTQLVKDFYRKTFYEGYKIHLAHHVQARRDQARNCHTNAWLTRAQIIGYHSSVCLRWLVPSRKRTR